MLSKEWSDTKRNKKGTNEYRKCSWTGEMCKYPEEFQNNKYSYKGKRMYQAFLNGLRLYVDGTLTPISRLNHPNNYVWEKVQREVRSENFITSRKKWLPAELTKEVYLRVYIELGMEFPDLDKIKNSSSGQKTQREWKTEKEVLDYFNIPEEGRQVWVGPYRVDGLKGSIIYEFYGDYWHANPEIYAPDDKIFGRTAGEKQSKDRKRLRYLSSKGYDIVVIWEKDWNEFRQGIATEVQFLEKIYSNEQSELITKAVIEDLGPKGLEKFFE